MDFTLTDEQQAFQTTARDFAAAEMMPHARAWDEGEIFPVAALRRAGGDPIVPTPPTTAPIAGPNEPSQ